MAKYDLLLLCVKKLTFNKGKRFSKPIINIAITGVALGITTIIISLAISLGYQQAIRDKVVSIGSHIRISNLDNNYSFDHVPFCKNQKAVENLYKNKLIEHIQYFATKSGIIKTDNLIEGIVLKGIDTSFGWNTFNTNIIKGNPLSLFPDTVSNNILISSALSSKLNLQIGDKVKTYFVQTPPMQRSFTVCGIYETCLPEFDEHFALIDIKHIQKLNHWDSTMIGGIEILGKEYGNIDILGEKINETIGYNLKAETIKQIYPQLFDWINLLDTNVVVLMIIVFAVCMVTIISTFFIIILEQISVIGILKTIGMNNSSISLIFLWIAEKILIKGLLFGNGLALLFYFIQKYTHFIKLDAAVYYVSYIPVYLNPVYVILINGGLIAVGALSLLLPAIHISKKISPISAIRFE